eukprot:scaffold20442_cov51-Attheya_sp.AAC.5
MGMNSKSPTDFTFSFRGFAKRGGCTDKHSHGWGLAIYEGNGLRTFLDPLPAADSPIAELVARYPVKTLNMMAHIRYATQGSVKLENVHPFSRELWGIHWCFAHNGDVPKFSNTHNNSTMPFLGKTQRRCGENLSFHPVGDTDSEAIFCAILNALKAEFPTLPTLPVLYETVQKLCCQILEGEEDSTIFNFLLGCGQYTMFAFSWPGARPGSDVWNGLFYTIRKPPFSMATLKDCDYAVDFATTNRDDDRIAIIATKPLTTNETWTEFEKGKLLMFNHGKLYSTSSDCQRPELKGRGLSSKSVEKTPTFEPLSTPPDNDLPPLDLGTALAVRLEQTLLIAPLSARKTVAAPLAALTR